MSKKIANIIRWLYHKLNDGKQVNVAFHNRIGKNVLLQANNGGSINIKRFFHVQRNVTIHADGGEIDIGENVFINENSMIVSHEKIELGYNVTIGPNVCIYDHDHNYKECGYISDEISIGKNVWIGANAVILRGTYLGNGCVVGAGTVVKGVFEDNTLITQEKKIQTKHIEKGKLENGK